MLVLLSVASVWTFVSALADPAHRYQRRIVASYLGVSTLLFGAGVALVIGPGVRNTTLQAAGMWLIVISALARKGIVPFHAWVPEVFDRGRLGPAILFSAPQLGAYITVVLIVPRASPDMLRVIALLALGTAVYGAALALVQTSARRACGYLFMSQSALVMAGLDCTSVSALAGGLLVWLSAGLAFAGLARAVLVLEARRGRLDLTSYHGGYERMPVLAISFLALGLACTGFPGTLGFVGQELLVDGAVDAFPLMGFAVVVASALTGLAVLRMYFSLFCGRPGPHHPFQPALWFDPPRSVDVRGARHRADWPGHRTASARRFAVRGQRRHSAATRSAQPLDPFSPAGVKCENGPGRSSPPGEQPSDGDSNRRGAEPGSQRMEVNEARALRADLEDANRRQPDSAAAARALRVGQPVRVRRSVIGPLLPSAIGTPPATSAEAVDNLGNRDHGRLVVVHRLTIDMTNAETTLEELGNWFEWSRTRHGKLPIKTRRPARRGSSAGPPDGSECRPRLPAAHPEAVT